LQVANSLTNYCSDTTKKKFEYSLCASTQHTVHLITQNGTCFKIQVCLYSAYLCSLTCNIQRKRLKRNHVYYTTCKFILCNIILHSFLFYTSQISHNSITRIKSPIQHNLHNGNFRGTRMFWLYIIQLLCLVPATHDIPHWHQGSIVKNVLTLYHVQFTNTHTATETLHL
jgi:hypothetical protein